MGIHGNREPPYPPLRHNMKTVGGQSQKQSYVHACVQVRPHTHMACRGHHLEPQTLLMGRRPRPRGPRTRAPPTLASVCTSLPSPGAGGGQAGPAGPEAGRGGAGAGLLGPLRDAGPSRFPVHGLELSLPQTGCSVPVPLPPRRLLELARPPARGNPCQGRSAAAGFGKVQTCPGSDSWGGQ